MTEERIIKRYSAYYAGWCVAFGEHDIAPERGTDIQWIFGEEKVGITLSPRLKKVFVRELLGKHEDIPTVTLAADSVRINDYDYPITDYDEQQSFRHFKNFFRAPGDDDIHMFLTSHFCYPQGTRIVTFARKKPLIIMYKEIQPLRLAIVD